MMSKLIWEAKLNVVCEDLMWKQGNIYPGATMGIFKLFQWLPKITMILVIVRDGITFGSFLKSIIYGQPK